MSIIQVRDLSLFKDKTLIFLSHNMSPLLIEDSFTYLIPESFSMMVADFKIFDFPSSPVICYDEGDMNWASVAYCLLKAMKLEVFVLYGGLRACEEEGLPLIKSSQKFLEVGIDAREIDEDLLVRSDIRSFTVRCLPFDVYKVLGKDITVKKMKKLLETHDVVLLAEQKILSGPSASILALLSVYQGNSFPSVYLGEWGKMRINESIQDTAFMSCVVSATDSVYYDAEEYIEARDTFSSGRLGQVAGEQKEIDLEKQEKEREREGKEKEKEDTPKEIENENFQDPDSEESEPDFKEEKSDENEPGSKDEKLDEDKNNEIKNDEIKNNDHYKAPDIPKLKDEVKMKLDNPGNVHCRPCLLF